MTEAPQQYYTLMNTRKAGDMVTTGEITMTEVGFEVDGREYWRLEVAAQRIGIHPQSLQRLWRNSGDTDDARVGLKLGRGLFFNQKHLATLGYDSGEGVE